MNHVDKTPHNKILVCLGDSITYGFPHGPQSSWVKELVGKIAVMPLNRGMNGNTTSDMLHRLPEELRNPGVSHVHILGGTNDAWMESNPEYSKRCIEQMVQMCFKKNITPILGITTPVCTIADGGSSFFPFGLDKIINWLNRHRVWLQEYAAAQSIPLIDYFTPLCQTGTQIGDPLYFIDEAHLSRAGNNRMAQVAIKALADMF
ncbi:MAG TPA: hypothetical protein DEF34_11610 [Desulfotomaculum sp.]|nr:MAG: hypothetical protein JL56_02230 [Desulfotomaculum sp. BICA1-6]HBX24259.1 hypothetical protein [Desulfotomaculum sp.]